MRKKFQCFTAPRKKPRGAERREAHQSMSAPRRPVLPSACASGRGARHRQVHATRRHLSACGARSPSGAPLAALARILSSGSAPGQAFWDAVGAHDPEKWKPVFRPDHAPKKTGVTRPFLSQSSDAPPAPVIMPAGVMPEAARERSCELRAQAPHPAPQSGSHPDAPSMSGTPTPYPKQ